MQLCPGLQSSLQCPRMAKRLQGHIFNRGPIEIKGDNNIQPASHSTFFSSLFFFKTFYSCIVPVGFLPWEIWVAFPGESQLRQSHATQPTVHAGCFSVSIIHRILTWTTGSLTCTQMLMHAIAHGGVRTHVKESALTL